MLSAKAEPKAGTEDLVEKSLPAAVEIEGLDHYYGERRALSAIELQLLRGSSLVVFGKNGAGKTTLLRILATLLTPSKGLVSILGSKLPDQAQVARAKIGFLGHEPLLYRDLTALENLLFYANLYGLGEPEQRSLELLSRVGIADRRNDPILELSQGMCQRVAICRALLADPELLLLDEPLSHLDPAASELLEPLIGRLSQRTRVLVTHSVEWGLKQSDMVLGLRDGRAEIVASADEVAANQVRDLYG